MKDIAFASTAQLAAGIRSGHVSASEVLEAHLAQIDQHNPAAPDATCIAAAQRSGSKSAAAARPDFPCRKFALRTGPSPSGTSTRARSAKRPLLEEDAARH